MENSTIRVGLVGTAGCACAMAAHFAVAQVPTPRFDRESLEEIVVTATKRVEKLQNIPIAVSVVSQEELQSQSLADTADLYRMVPDLQFQHGISPGNDAFGIRGITTLAAGPTLDSSVGVAFDGVPLGRNVGSVADIVDVRSVEVLKGPQGMLFGKNASAGVINIATNSPELGKTDALLRASFGTLNLRQYTGTFNLPVTDDSAIRLSAWKFQHDGPIHEVNTNQDLNNKNSQGARLKYRWQATEDLDLNATGEWTSHDQNGTGLTIRAFNPSSYGPPPSDGATIEAWERAHGTVPSDHNRTARGADLPYYDKGHTAAYTGQANYSIGDGTITGIVSYRNIYSDDQYDVLPTDNPLNHLTKNQDTVKYDQLSEEIHYISPVAERIRYVVGLYNFRMKLRESAGLGIDIAAGPTTLHVYNDLESPLVNDSYAAFGEATFDITSKLHFIAGLRRSTDKLSASFSRGFLSPAPPIIPGFNGPGDASGVFSTAASTIYNDLSWRTGLQYQFTPDAMIYATVSRGYKGPGVGYGSFVVASDLAKTHNGLVNPEISHNVELGIRSQWFDHRLTLNMTVYDETVDGFQVSIVVPGPNPLQATENAGQAKTTGVDFDARWLVTPGLTLSGSATYDHARYTDFKDAPCYFTQTEAQGCVNSIQNLDGQRLASTPKITTNLTARYEHSLGSKFRGFIQGNHTYRSSVIYDSTGNPATTQGGYSLVNLNAGINTTDGRWGVSVYGNNVFNKHYVDYITIGMGSYFYLNDIGYEDLQTFGVALTAHF